MPVVTMSSTASAAAAAAAAAATISVIPVSHQTSSASASICSSSTASGGCSMALPPTPSSTNTAVAASSPLTVTSTNSSPASSKSPETAWLPFIRDVYPNLHGQTYFLPPLHFNKVPFYTEDVAGETVRVLATPPPPPKRRAKPPPLVPEPQVSGSVFTSNPSGLQASQVLQSDVQDDEAQAHTLECLRALAERTREVMMVISQLQFRKYLDSTINPLHAATAAVLPGTQNLSVHLVDGECDVLIIHPRHGLVVAEIKSVGSGSHFSAASLVDQHKRVVEKVKRAVNQLNNQTVALTHLVSDLGVKVTKTLILPNITSAQLKQALCTDPAAMQALCQCMGVQKTSSALKRCLCQDGMPDSKQLQFLSHTHHMPPWHRLRATVFRQFRSLRDRLQSSSSNSIGTVTSLTRWWQTTVVNGGVDPLMSTDIYERLMARFCGPATTVGIPTVTPPRKTIRTEGEAVAETGLRISRLALYPAQVHLLNSPLPPCVYLQGPPGCGKTVVLVLKARQWLNQGKQVHVLSMSPEGRAVTFLMYNQLQRSVTAAGAVGKVQCHYYNFVDKPRELPVAVKKMISLAHGGDLHVLIDEVGSDEDHFIELITKLHSAVPTLSLWSAGLWTMLKLPPWVNVQSLTDPLRCPPSVHKQVAQAKGLGDLVPEYTCPPGPAVSEGPAVKWLQHEDQPGHTERFPRHCVPCGETIAHLLRQLRVGEPGQLQYRDVFILTARPSDHSGMVCELRRHQVPVKVVTSRAKMSDITDMALAVTDQVIVADHETVSGLERRVVIGMEDRGHDRLWAMSRSTAQLSWIDKPDRMYK